MTNRHVFEKCQTILLVLLLSAVLLELIACKSGSTGVSSSLATSSAAIDLSAHTGQLNDTGLQTCATESLPQTICPQADFPGQDAEYGRDTQGLNQPKTGGGQAGFDWTKLGTNGERLAHQSLTWRTNGTEYEGSRWACVLDNVTGLTWEIKEIFAEHPRYHGHTYSWWMDSEALNAGFTIKAIPGNCRGISPCDTQTYVNWVNEEGLCGHHDWRLPSIAELSSLVVLANERPAMDTDYFPDALQPRYFTSQTFAGDPSRAWYVYFSDGSVSSTGKGDASYVRLVRGGSHE